MKIQKFDTGVWVRYHDNKPDKQDEYIVNRKGQIMKIVFSEMEDSPINEMWEGVREWQKPLKDVYVLTEDELRIIYDKGFTEGMKEQTHFYGGKKFEEVLQSITETPIT